MLEHSTMEFGQVFEIKEKDNVWGNGPLRYVVGEFGGINYPNEMVLVGESIWDVLRVGDFVNGYRIEKIEKDVMNGKPKILTGHWDYNWQGDGTLLQFYEEDIEDIMTYEQYSINCWEFKDRINPTTIRKMD